MQVHIDNAPQNEDVCVWYDIMQFVHYFFNTFKKNYYYYYYYYFNDIKTVVLKLIKTLFVMGHFLLM